MIDPKFKNIMRLFALSVKKFGNDRTRNSFDKSYLPLTLS